MRGEFFDLAELALNAESVGFSAWGNFGDWTAARSYPDAAAALAHRLAGCAGLGADDRVLDLGFGMGEQLRLWRSAYGVRALIGINPSASQCALARQRAPGFVLHQTGAEQVARLVPAGSIDCVLALDSAYHFTGRAQLYAELAGLLAPGGRWVFTDLLRPAAVPGAPARAALRAALRACRVPRRNFVDADTCRAQLLAAGFVRVEIEILTDVVLAPFARWWRSYRHRVPRARRRKFDLVAVGLAQAAARGWLDYALIRADRGPTTAVARR